MAVLPLAPPSAKPAQPYSSSCRPAAPCRGTGGPEQLRGRKITARKFLWALGTILEPPGRERERVWEQGTWGRKDRRPGWFRESFSRTDSRRGAPIASSSLSSRLPCTSPPPLQPLPLCSHAHPPLPLEPGDLSNVTSHPCPLHPARASLLLCEPTELSLGPLLCTRCALSWLLASGPLLALSLQCAGPRQPLPRLLLSRGGQPTALHHSTYGFPSEHLPSLESSCILIMYLFIVCLLWRGAHEFRGGRNICPTHLPVSGMKTQRLVPNGSSVHVAGQFHYLVILVLNPWHSARDPELPDQ